MELISVNSLSKNFQISEKQPGIKGTIRHLFFRQINNVTAVDKLDFQINEHEVSWHWVKGHAGNENNEMADHLARRFIEENQ